MLIIITIGLSYFYSLLSKVMPIIYFCVIISIGFGLAIGYIARFSSKIFRLTNKREVLIGTILFAMIGVYASWIAYVDGLNENYYSTNSFTSYIKNSNLWLNPSLLIDSMKTISETGLWQIFGALINGTTLWIVWIIEALIIIGASIFTILPLQIAPFSSRTNKWYKKYVLNKQFRTIVNKDRTIEEFLKNPEMVIDNMVNGETNRHSIISIYFLEEESKQYLKIDNLRYDRDGKSIYNKTVIDNLEISSQTAKNLINKYFAQKGSYFN